MRFTELNLHPDLERGLKEAGYITCMPVQEQVLQHAFGGQDLYVQSQTGTGKTAAFLVVIFQRLLSEPMIHGKKAIIMVPTRELAVQVEEEAKLLGKYLPFKIGSFYGGVGYTQQTKMLRENVQILVGTPGRVLDMNKGGQMNLMEIAFLILDEADRMFDMGFYPDLRKLIRVVPPADRRQTMLFSATLNSWVKNLAWEYTKNPFEIAIEPETITVEEVEQQLYHVSSQDKMKLLLGILKREDPESAIIFCNTKRYTEIIAKRLRLNGVECEYIMGDLPQTKRLKIINDIKTGKLRFLVATDVAARGLDIEGLALVVNYDLPNESENYVHRIGRTARAGKTGKAITLVSEQDVYELPPIERYINRKLPSETATKELFAEDKSEGRHIRTDSDTERGEGRVRGEGRQRGEGRMRGHGHQARKSPAAHREREHKPRRDDRQKKRREFPSETGQTLSDVKLSELSLEERMAYYRKKYDKSGMSDHKSAEQTKSTPNSQKTKGHGNERKRDKGRPMGKDQGKQQQKHRPHGKTRRSSKAVNNIDQKTLHETNLPQPQESAQENAKKGILSRLFGGFGKKKD